MCKRNPEKEKGLRMGPRALRKLYFRFVDPQMGSGGIQKLQEQDIHGYSQFVDHPWNGPSGVIGGANTTRNRSTSAFFWGIDAGDTKI